MHVSLPKIPEIKLIKVPQMIIHLKIVTKTRAMCSFVQKSILVKPTGSD
jgi:hypothetical protein